MNDLLIVPEHDYEMLVRLKPPAALQRELRRHRYRCCRPCVRRMS
jgi:hypothetical protein